MAESTIQKSIANDLNTVSSNLTTLSNDITQRFTTASIKIDTANMTEFSFTNLNSLTNSRIFKHGLLVWGVDGSTENIGLSIVFVSTNNAVTIKNVTGTGRTFTGTVNGNTLTITGSGVVYGGLKLIWLT